MQSFSSVTEVNTHWSLTTEVFADRVSFLLYTTGVGAVRQFNFFPKRIVPSREGYVEVADSRPAINYLSLRSELIRLHCKPAVISEVRDVLYLFYGEEIL